MSATTLILGIQERKTHLTGKVHLVETQHQRAIKILFLGAFWILLEKQHLPSLWLTLAFFLWIPAFVCQVKKAAAVPAYESWGGLSGLALFPVMIQMPFALLPCFLCSLLAAWTFPSTGQSEIQDSEGNLQKKDKGEKKAASFLSQRGSAWGPSSLDLTLHIRG